MGLFDKVKNLFTEEVEEEKPIKKEVRHIEIPSPKREEVKVEQKIVEEPVQEKEKFVFFDDKDFEDLEKKEQKELKIEKKEEPKIEKKLPYNGNKPVVAPIIEKKVFTPSPIISPVYGVLDKNYKKDDIASKRERPKKTYISTKELTVDDVRDRAFSTIEDDLKNDLLQNDYVISKREIVEDDLDMFGDIDNEIDEKDTLGSIESLNDDIMINENDSLFDEDIDDDTEVLALKLKEQQRKLDEINDIINDEEPKKTRLTLDEVLEKAEKHNDILSDEEVENNYEDKAEQDEEIKEGPVEETISEESEDIGEVEEIVASKDVDAAFDEAFDDLDSAISTNNEQKEKPKKNKDLTDSELLNLIDTMYEKRDDEEE